MHILLILGDICENRLFSMVYRQYFETEGKSSIVNKMKRADELLYLKRAYREQ